MPTPVRSIIIVLILSDSTFVLARRQPVPRTNPATWGMILGLWPDCCNDFAENYFFSGKQRRCFSYEFVFLALHLLNWPCLPISPTRYKVSTVAVFLRKPDVFAACRHLLLQGCINAERSRVGRDPRPPGEKPLY